MIIDVADLEFETLHFNRSYDSLRYKRGTNIYNNGYVEIKKVNQTDKENYSIEASVDGNYDTYTTTLKIHGNMINNCTCTCEDYYKGYLCKHIIATSMEVIDPHCASTKEGKAKLEQAKKEEAKRALEELKRKQEEERKEREYQRKYYSGLQTMEIYKRLSRDSSNTSLNLNELYEETLEAKNKKAGNLATSMKIETFIEVEDSKTLRASFKIGQTRMYVLNNICDFYEAYKNQSELNYGKQLRFIPKKENFTEDSQAMFDFIVKYAEMIEYNNTFSDYRMSSSFYKGIYITGERIDEFFKINNNKEVMVCSNYYGNIKHKLTDDKLDVKCILNKERVEIPSYNYWYYEEDYEEESEEYVIKLNIEDYDVLFSYDKIYVFYNNLIYRMDKNGKLTKLFDLFRENEKIIIPEDRLEEFKNIVLSQIDYIQAEDANSEQSSEVLIANNLASKVLLDVDDKGNITLELKFCYMNFEFNVLEARTQNVCKTAQYCKRRTCRNRSYKKNFYRWL